MTDRSRLDGRVAVVTGASSGLGVAFAVGLADAGADVVVTARRTDRLAETVAAVASAGRACLAVTADVSDPAAGPAVVAAAVERFSRVDILVNNAGVASSVPATREPPEAFRSVLDVNLAGAYWMAQACGRVMRPGSSIVNVSSVLALTSGGLPQAAYTASKAGLLGLTRDLAQQWGGRKGIRVNALLPGFFETEMTAEYDPAYLENLVDRRVPLGRLGRSEELVDALRFLVADTGTYVTGVALPVDGGFLLS